MAVQRATAAVTALLRDHATAHAAAMAAEEAAELAAAAGAPSAPDAPIDPAPAALELVCTVRCPGPEPTPTLPLPVAGAAVRGCSGTHVLWPHHEPGPCPECAAVLHDPAATLAQIHAAATAARQASALLEAGKITSAVRCSGSIGRA